MDALINIIPKITSPLAVICFAIYIFYLIKQSGDKTKEKALLAGNDDAKRDAVNKILKDYPDIKLKDLTSEGSVEIAKEIVRNKIIVYQKTLTFLLLFALIFAATFLMSLGISNNKFLEKLATGSNKSWAETNTLAKGKDPYAMLSVMCHIQLIDSLNQDNKLITRAYFRYFYTLKATEDITLDQNVFEEQYCTNGARVKPWAGTELQDVEAILDNQYWVKFAMKKNEISTIATGANYIYDYTQLDNGDGSCFGKMDLKGDEWFTCYPNTIDFIDKLTIIVEGENINLNLLPQAAYRKLTNGFVKQSEAVCKVFVTDNKCTLIANWSNISPGECVGLKVGCNHLTSTPRTYTTNVENGSHPPS